MKIHTDLKVIAAEGLEKAVAAELATEDGDLETLLAEQQKAASDEREDAKDNTESV